MLNWHDLCSAVVVQFFSIIIESLILSPAMLEHAAIPKRHALHVMVRGWGPGMWELSKNSFIYLLISPQALLRHIPSILVHFV